VFIDDVEGELRDTGDEKDSQEFEKESANVGMLHED